jgi:hypothetical protein
MDGEQEPVSPDEHLLLCVDCQGWEAAATALTWATWLPDVPKEPDVTAAVLNRLRGAGEGPA